MTWGLSEAEAGFATEARFGLGGLVGVKEQFEAGLGVAEVRGLLGRRASRRRR